MTCAGLLTTYPRMSDDMKTLGARLKAVRLARGITQSFAARVAGLNQRSGLSNIEGGRQSATVKVLRALASLYRCSMDELAAVGTPLPPVPFATEESTKPEAA